MPRAPFGPIAFATMRLFAPPSALMPSRPLFRIRFASGGVSPPMVLLDPDTWTPSKRFGMDAPAWLTPIQLPCSSFAELPSTIPMALPATTFPAPVAVPPIALLLPAPVVSIPKPVLPRAAPPPSVVPMRLPWIVIPGAATKTPVPLLPEMTLPRITLPDPLEPIYTPRRLFGIAPVPFLFVPIRFPSTTLLAAALLKVTPAPNPVVVKLPESTFPSPGLGPPTVFPLLTRLMPSRLPSGARPSAVVPM